MQSFCTDFVFARYMLDLNDIIRSRVGRELPGCVVRRLERLLHIEDINDILTAGQGLSPQEFLRYVFQRLDVRYDIRQTARLYDDRYIFVANHPFGALDGMMLADWILGRWGDVGVVVNDILSYIEPLRGLWIPVNKYGHQHSAELYRRAMESAEKQILIFPAGMCSRWRDGGVADLEWQARFVKDARRYDRCVVPVFVDGALSRRFYNIYRFRRMLRIEANVELLLLVDELFGQRGSQVSMVVGEPMDMRSLKGSVEEQCRMVRSEVYRLREYLAVEPRRSIIDCR